MTFIVLYTNDGSRADSVHGFHAVTGIFDAVTTTRENLLVTGGVKIGEAFGELHFLTVDGNGAVGRLLALDGLWQIIGVDGEEPAHASVLVFQIAGSFVL